MIRKLHYINKRNETNEEFQAIAIDVCVCFFWSKIDLTA